VAVGGDGDGAQPEVARRGHGNADEVGGHRHISTLF
jgi:hypothetical protein